MLDLLTVGQEFTRPARCTATTAIEQYLPPVPMPDLSAKPTGHYSAAIYGTDRLTNT